MQFDYFLVLWHPICVFEAEWVGVHPAAPLTKPILSVLVKLILELRSSLLLVLLYLKLICGVRFLFWDVMLAIFSKVGPFAFVFCFNTF